MARATAAKAHPKQAAPAAPRVLDAFDTLRTTRALAPHDLALNDVRWLIGEALRRRHQRIGAGLSHRDVLHAAAAARRVGEAPAEAELQAAEVLRRCQNAAGPAHWPILRLIVLEGRRTEKCRALIPEVLTPWRADACVMDRLRVGLDAIGHILGVTGPSR